MANYIKQEDHFGKKWSYDKVLNDLLVLYPLPHIDKGLQPRRDLIFSAFKVMGPIPLKGGAIYMWQGDRYYQTSYLRRNGFNEMNY